MIQVGNSAAQSVDLPTRGFRNQLGRIIGHTNFKTSRERKREAFTAMCRHALAGELTVEVEGVPLREIGRAWRRESPHRKVVIEVSPDTSGGAAELPAGGDVEAESEAAATEAGRIGGNVPPLADDPAREPLAEAGEGESEGQEQTEQSLRDATE